MARLPIPGSDDGTWGDILNEFLSVSHQADGSMKPDTINAATLQDSSVSTTKLQNSAVTESKLNAGSGIDGQVLTKDAAMTGGFKWAPAPSAPVTSVAGKTGAVTLTKDDVSLNNVDNTSDANKPISTAQQAALDARPVWVDATNPNAPRPSGAIHVFWVGGTIQPTNMAAGDVWLMET